MKTIISANNVSFQYKDAKINALTNLNFKIEKGKFILICGPTGSGKTSLIRVINGLIPHFYHGTFYGVLKIDELDTCEIKDISCLSKNVGTVFQIPENQLFCMDVEREIAFSLENLGFEQKEIKKIIDNIIELLKIENLRHRPPFELSGGEQQKVAIASLLALNPEILILDEPLSNLDPESAVEIINLLKELQIKNGKTIIISEHRLEYVIPFADEILVLDKGTVLIHDIKEKVFNQDQIYQIGLDIPPILNIIWKLKKKGEYKENIPLKTEEQIEIIKNILLEKSNIQNHSNRSSIINNGKAPLITFQEVNLNYIIDKTIIRALNNISLTINRGEIIGIIGANGAGKSTLIRSILGLIKNEQGQIWVKDAKIENKPVHKLARIIGLMFQNPDHQLFATSVEDELLFSLKNLHLKKDEINKRIKNISESLEINTILNESPFNISGGQKKKVSIASILCREPEILIFDEPTIGQDGVQKKKLKEIILSNSKKGYTIIIVSHDLEFISSFISRLIVLKKGSIYADGTPEDILTNNELLKECSLNSMNMDIINNVLHYKEKIIKKPIINMNALEDMLV